MTRNLLIFSGGGYSQLKAELLAFTTALEHGTYEYIHLISGQDLPIKSQDYIHEFFDNLPPGSNLIGFAKGEFNARDLQYKAGYYHLFTQQSRKANKIQRKFFSMIRRSVLFLQEKLGFSRKWDMPLFKGCNWVSVTTDFAKYLVDNSLYITKKFRWVQNVDEIYKQTMFMNSPFRDTLLDRDSEYAQIYRKIDWQRGNPYTWRSHDFSELMESNALYARKFSSGEDKDIIDKICCSLKGDVG